MKHTSLLRDLPTAFSPIVTSDERELALGLLCGLKVRDDTWTPRHAYERQLVVSIPKFAHVGLDMKDYILARDLIDKVYDSDGFTLRSGILPNCPYSGNRVEFDQTEIRSEFLIQIDHVVAIADAWDSGGYKWSPKGRKWQKFCNDPANLLAVSRPANRAKDRHNAATWLPHNDVFDFKQRFVVLQIRVKDRYKLSVTESEQSQMQAILAASN